MLKIILAILFVIMAMAGLLLEIYFCLVMNSLCDEWESAHSGKIKDNEHNEAVENPKGDNGN